MPAVGLNKESRMKKTMLNAKVNFIFYFLTLIANFVARKIFLDYLGDNFVGLTGTLMNILGYLNLAELGVSSAIAFNLYKPIKEGDTTRINSIISLMGYYYRNIGLIVAGAGVVFSVFLFLIFRDSAFTEYGVIYFAFYAFLISALLGYFVNYRQILLTADQRNYVVTSMFQSSNIIKALVQIFVAVKLRNFYAWIAIEIVFAVGYSILLNHRISKVYPWLRSKVKEGKMAAKQFPDIFKSTKQVFIHKIKDFLLVQSDQLFVFIFVSLKMVAFYGNYVMVINRLMGLFNTLLDSVVASVGNLIAENDLPKMLKVFWELMAVRYFIAGMLSFLIYILIDPFIVLWVGEQYLLSNLTLILFTVNLFILVSRGTVDNFNFAFGHFADVWSAWTELAINVGVTIVCGYFWGIPGILLGKTVSMIPIVVFWKPCYLFKDGFKMRYRNYWKGTSRYLLCLAFSVIVGWFIISFIPIDASYSFLTWGVFAVISTIIFGSIYFSSIMMFCPGGRHLLKRIRRK